MHDPEIYEVIATLFEGAPQPLERGDWLARRNQSEGFYGGMFPANFGNVECRSNELNIPSYDGTVLLCQEYTPQSGDFERVVVYFHGGGFIGGSVASHDVWCRWLARETQSQVISVGYRLAPEFPAPVPQEDSFSATAWIAQRNEASMHPVPIVVAGDSSGAGLAASVALMARDRNGPVIDAQVLIHPMLDDRSTPIADDKVPYLTWSKDDNDTAWQALLADKAGSEDVSPYVASARMEDLSGVPTTYIEICKLDLFYSEGIKFFMKLMAADIEVEAHVLRGVPHAFDVLAPEAGVSQRMLATRCAFIKSVR